MSSVINQSWYSQNATRSYPLVDGPGAFTTDGQPFPTDIIVDARIRTPLNPVDWIELSGVSVGPSLTTAVFSVNGGSGRRAGGAVSVIGALVPGRPYPVTPVLGGQMTGWVVFGPGATKPGNWRLADGGCRLAPRAGQNVSQGPVTSLAKLRHPATLRQVINLIAGQDLEIVNEIRSIDGVQREAVVLRLKAELDSVEVFKRYLGDCGGRPESGSCRIPPIERIGTAVPDCDGNINLIFDPPLSAVPTASGSGLAVGHLFGLTETCTEETYGSRFPGEVDLGCSSLGPDGSEGLPDGDVVLDVFVTPGFEAGRTVTLDTVNVQTLTLGTYHAVFHNVSYGVHTVEISSNEGEIISWEAFFAGDTGSGPEAVFLNQAPRTFEQIIFNIRT